MRILSPEEVASLPIYKAWLAACLSQPLDMEPPQLDSLYGHSLYRKHKLGRFTGQPTIDKWAAETERWSDYCLLRDQIPRPPSSNGPTGHDPGWVPAYLSLYLLPEPTRSELFEDVFLPYELALGFQFSPYLYPPPADPLKRFGLI